MRNCGIPLQELWFPILVFGGNRLTFGWSIPVCHQTTPLRKAEQRLNGVVVVAVGLRRVVIILRRHYTTQRGLEDESVSPSAAADDSADVYKYYGIM